MDIVGFLASLWNHLEEGWWWAWELFSNQNGECAGGHRSAHHNSLKQSTPKLLWLGDGRITSGLIVSSLHVEHETSGQGHSQGCRSQSSRYSSLIFLVILLVFSSRRVIFNDPGWHTSFLIEADGLHVVLVPGRKSWNNLMLKVGLKKRTAGSFAP